MWKPLAVGWLICACAVVQAYDEPTVKQLWQETQSCLERLRAKDRRDPSVLYRMAPAQIYAGDYDAGMRTASSLKDEVLREMAQASCWQAILEMDGRERDLPAEVSEITRWLLITNLVMLHIQTGDASAAARAIEKMPTEGVYFIYRAELYWRLGMAQLKRDEKAAALQSLGLARMHADRIPPGSSIRATKLYIVIAETYAAAGDLAAARESLARAAHWAEKDEKHEGPDSLISISWAWVARGQARCQMPEDSARSFARAVDIAKAIPKERDGFENRLFHSDRAKALNTISAFEFRAGRLQQAAEHFRQAVQSLMAEPEESGRDGHLKDLIDDQSRGGDPALARSALDRVQSTNYRVRSQCVVASCLFDRGEADQAAALVRDAESRLGEPVDLDSVGARLEVAETWARLKQPEAANNSFQQAKEAAAKLKAGDYAALPIAASQWRSGYFEAAYEALKRLPSGKDKCLGLAELTTAAGKARAPRQILQPFALRTIADPF